MNDSRSGFPASLGAGFSVALLAFCGCGQGQEGGGQVTSAPPTTVDAQKHPTEGPHHGQLIELGNEEYHAEFLHDEASGAVTVYLLDSPATTDVPIEATELRVNLSHDGQAEQFTLSPTPQPSDPSGKSSKFTSTDAKLAEKLDREGGEAQLVVTIDGKQYRGTIHHDHDHEAQSE